MDPRLARRLIGLYPARWRQRYGDEFSALLEDQPRSFSTIVNVVGGACREHARSSGAFHMNPQQKTLMLMAFAYLAAVAAGVNFYWSVNDTPLAAVMRNNGFLSASFRAVALGSFAAFFAVIAIAAPVTASIAWAAFKERRWLVLGRISVPFSATFILIVWLAAGTLVTGRHWVATPWDVTGDWPAPADWPALSIRWTMSSVTFALLVCGLMATAVAASQVIRDSDLSRHRAVWFKTTSIAFAAAVLVMTAGVAGWGWFAQQYAASDFHARNGGLFNSTNIASWSASCAVFVGASILAIRGARESLGDAAPRDCRGASSS